MLHVTVKRHAISYAVAFVMLATYIDNRVTVYFQSSPPVSVVIRDDTSVLQEDFEDGYLPS